MTFPIIASEKKLKRQGKYEAFFDTRGLSRDMKQKSIRGGFSSMGSEVFTFVLRIVSTIVLARILLPEHFGLISMVTALTLFAERFKDLGLSTATVQKGEITHEQVSTLFWINVGFGLVLMMVVAALSGAISRFYGDGRLVGITVALSSGFLFGGLTVQHQALLRRRMRFDALAKIKIFANVISIFIAIFFAWRGFQYWALVFKEVSRPALVTLGTWSACRWWPGLPVRRSGIGDMLRFGRDVAGFDAIYFLSKSVDQILLGRYWGAVALGFYKQAHQLISTPVGQIQYPLDYVAIPALSAVQSDIEKFQRYYTKFISFLSFLYMPIIVYLAIFSEDVVRLLLGEKWIQSSGIFKVLAVASFIQPVANTAGTVMVTCGKTRRYVAWGAMNALFFIISFSIGNLWGGLGIAYCYTATSYLVLVPLLHYALKYTPISLSLFFRSIYLQIVNSLIMGAVLIMFSHAYAATGRGLNISISLAIASFVYMFLWILFPVGRVNVLSYLEDIISVFHKKSFKLKPVK